MNKGEKMYKVATTALMSLFLVGCQGGSGSEKDWIEAPDGCEKYFSETGYDLKSCKNYLARKENKMEPYPVTTNATGTEILPTKGIKDFENTEENEIDN